MHPVHVQLSRDVARPGSRDTGTWSFSLLVFRVRDSRISLNLTRTMLKTDADYRLLHVSVSGTVVRHLNFDFGKIYCTNSNNSNDSDIISAISCSSRTMETCDKTVVVDSRSCRLRSCR